MLKKVSRSTKQKNLKKNNLVIVEHAATRLATPQRLPEGHPTTWPDFTLHAKRSLAIVLDTNRESAYVVYAAGPGYKAKPEPFWIDTEYLTLLGVQHASDNSGD